MSARNGAMLKKAFISLVFGVLAACAAKPAAVETAAADGVDTAAPDAEIAGFVDANADTAAPDALAPDASAPDALAPDASAPDALAPDAPAPDVPVPDASAPDAPDAPPTCTTSVCGDGKCTTNCEKHSTCPQDCPTICGDGECSGGENPKACPEDCCGSCGDGKCIAYSCGEQDPTSKNYCAKDCSIACGDGKCAAGETPANCAQDCALKACGNHQCEVGETPQNCKEDCGTTCGNCLCEKGESYDDCPIDCGFCGDGVCSPCKDAAGLAVEATASCQKDCEFSECNPAFKGKQCGDDDVCTDDSCSALGKCQHLANSADCSDFNACTAGDVCKNGSCVGGDVADCNDGEACTDDSCNKSIGCIHVAKADASKCSDGSPCTSKDACKLGKCLGVAINCNDDNPCTDDDCDVDVGSCVHLPGDATGCDDGNGCTGGDSCKGGVCKGGKAANCDDGNSCTFDGCDGNLGCTHLSIDAKACDDGNFCTKDDACLKGACAGSSVVCNDGNACTDDSCAPLSGCVYANNALDCDDKDPCTSADHCAAGKCTGKMLDCDDKNVCTDDSCDKFKGCVNAANAVGCDDGVACTVADVCAGGNCVGAAQFFGNTYGAVGDDSANGLATLKDGGSAIIGTTYSEVLPGGQFGFGESDIWLVRTDATGKLSWSMTYGGSGIDQAKDITAVSAGGFGIVAWTTSVDLPAYPKSDPWNSHLWLIRTDANGKMLWSRLYLNDAAQARIVVTNTGGFAVASYLSVGVLPTGQGNYDFRLLRTDAAGNLLWNKSYGGGDFDRAYAVAALSDGGFVLAGETKSTDLPGGKKSLGGDDVWIVRTDDSGNLLWNQTYGGTGDEYANAVLALADGGFAVAGITNSLDLPSGQKTAGKNDFFLLRTDANGNVLWNRTYGGADNDSANALAGLPGGGFALAGSSFSADLPGGSKNYGSYDIWLLNTDNGGNLVWSNTYGGKKGESAVALAVAVDGTVVVAGSTDSIDLPGGKQTLGSHDFYLLRTDPWGHASCAESGTCFNKKPADCDDAKPCTADVCDGKLGCQHSNLADGSACGGGKACKAGLCL